MRLKTVSKEIQHWSWLTETGLFQPTPGRLNVLTGLPSLYVIGISFPNNVVTQEWCMKTFQGWTSGKQQQCGPAAGACSRRRSYPHCPSEGVARGAPLFDGYLPCRLLPLDTPRGPDMWGVAIGHRFALFPLLALPTTRYVPLGWLSFPYWPQFH